MRQRTHLVTRALAAIGAGLFIAAPFLAAQPAAATSAYAPISGAGSTWSANALQQWIANVRDRGLLVNYADTGSSDGRNQYKNGTVDFAVSEIPYGLQDGNSSDPPPQRGFAYMPIVAGGTSFMYNLTIGGQRVTQLRMSGEAVAKVFTGQITQWNDPLIQQDNPGLVLPAVRITPVVRSDGSGTTAQFTAWMLDQHPGVYQEFCQAAARNPCTQTSNYPNPGNAFQAKGGSQGVAGFVAQSAGSITYVEYSYARNAGFPVVKVLNKAGYFIEPTAEAVAVGLLGAEIDERDPTSLTYLTQRLQGVYNNQDARAYPLSSYSYMVIPTSTANGFTTQKGRTLSDFAYYFLCKGQEQADDLGYSPLPLNLVQAGFKQVARIPGVVQQQLEAGNCENPTFSADGRTNKLAQEAPQPPACAKQGPLQCDTAAQGGGGTGGGTGGGGESDGGGGGGGGDSGDSGGGGGAGTGGTGTTGGDAGGTPGVAPGAAGDGTVPAAGADALGGDLGGVDLDGDGVADTGAVDEFGQPVAAGTGGVANVSAVPVNVAGSGFTTTHLLVILTVVTLLAATVGPPLLSRRLDRGRSAEASS